MLRLRAAAVRSSLWDQATCLQAERLFPGGDPTSECICKPDLVAPGNRILSCAPGTDFAYGVKSGTSMSTPLVSGAAALLLQKYPTLTNVEIKKCLKESARDLGLPRNLQGSGELDMKQALTNESISVKMIRKM